MAAFDEDAFDNVNAFDTDAFDFAGVAASVASDGGGIWPPRLGDPRWEAFLTANGVTPSRGGIGNDVREALGNALGFPPTTTRRLSVDDIWHKYLESIGRKGIGNDESFPP